jgi:hypothetical protein
METKRGFSVLFSLMEIKLPCYAVPRDAVLCHISSFIYGDQKNSDADEFGNGVRASRIDCSCMVFKKYFKKNFIFFIFLFASN